MPGTAISPAAQDDIESIFAWTHEHFGQQARLRYEALLVQAILDVVDHPDRVGSHARGEIASAARTYHLWHSRNRVEPAGDRVRQPRHFLLYRTGNDGRVEIGRVLHERVDLAQHLPEGYEPDNPGEQPPGSP